MTASYVDASALAKLVLDESDSGAMRSWYIERDRVFCSRVGIVETRRAVTRSWHDQAQVDVVLNSVEVIEFDAEIARRAGSIGPASLRTLDAIHLASCFRLGSELDAFVTYDIRLAKAARLLGLPLIRPA